MKKILMIMAVSLFVAGGTANAGSGCAAPLKELLQHLTS